MQTEPGIFRVRLFVYGTLKRGFANHYRFCRGALHIEEATVRGRLYELPAGYPALAVPWEDVRATGTADYLADAITQDRLEETHPANFPNSSEGWDTVGGELISFGDPAERLPALDALEGFRPGGPSLYRRVLVPVGLSGSNSRTLAWTYTIEKLNGTYLPEGRWPVVCAYGDPYS